jgi:DnaJ-class molecular chaperone
MLVYGGEQHMLVLKVFKDCEECAGTGYDFGDGGQCDSCGGTGDYTDPFRE